MVLTHNLGYPRIGAKRELKFALEAYWRGAGDRAQLQQTGAELRAEHWREQAVCDLQPVGDFSFYDHVLDTSFLLGHVPERFKALDPNDLDTYFAVARGQHEQAHCCGHAAEMTKWFDTNYHYIVPELTRETRFSLHSNWLLQQVQEARRQGVNAKPVLLGPVTYLWLSKCKDDSLPLDYLDQLVPLYQVLLEQLAEAGVPWVQLDEPILVTELNDAWSHALTRTYHLLNTRQINILVASYFGELKENLQLACQLPVAGLHVDAVRGQREVVRLVDWLPPHKVLSLGVIDGRNVWKADLNRLLGWIEPLLPRLQERLWLAPSCSLLHVPVDLNQETALPQELANWLSFANQKLQELEILKIALNHGRDAVQQALQENAEALQQRAASSHVHAAPVQAAIAEIQAGWRQRHSNYAERAPLQRAQLRLPPYPTTTIGSFPQTTEIRKLRRGYKNGELPKDAYERTMQQAIADAIRHQEELGLDVLVHGEAERNDMVEYFGEQLSGFAFTVQGWVQSYGSRCVKPPIIYGDVARPKAMTVAWTRYAQSLTDQPVKGMLTGPVTLLNWSFVRDDQPRQQTCEQLALAVREEVLDLEAAAVKIIQIDEAALREGLPLRRSDWQAYLDWAVDAFRLSANSVADTTQIHTHMCYSEFNDILDDIARMDADVITIETSRSDMELLEAFRRFNYPNDIGPGVYDIHSPAIPSQEQIVRLLSQAAERVPPERLWVNPDCGLKTRSWKEVLPALRNMVAAARQMRDQSAMA